MNLNPAKCEALCISIINTFHLLLYTTVRSAHSLETKSEVFGHSPIQRLAILGRSLQVRMFTPKPQGFLTFCGECFMIALNLQGVRVSAHYS